MTKYLYLLLFFLFLGQTVSFANNECADAIELFPTATCTYTTGSFSGATMSSAVSPCAQGATQDVWYKFTATSKTMSISVERSSTNWDMYFTLEFLEDSCSGNQFKCVGTRRNSNYYYNSDFVIGKTYFLRVANAAAINSFNFRLCVQALPSPANDLCANATEIFPTSQCTYTTGTFTGALLETTVQSCAQGAAQDVWYKFTATSKTMSIYVERASTNWDMYFTLEFMEDSCNGNQFKCVGTRLNSNYYYNSDFVIGKTYFLRVANAATINSFNFKLCIQALPSPANDTCANATEILPTSECTYTTGTFSGALLDSAVPSCAANASQDVWYKFTATSKTMSIYVERSSTNWDMYFGLEFREDSCTGNQFKCIGSRLNANYYYNSDFVIGKTYFLRVANATTINSFNFKLCIVALPTPANDTCANATEIFPTSDCTFTTGTFSGALLDTEVPSCAQSASQDVWYKFTATSKTMSIYVERASTNWDMYFGLEFREDSCTGNQFKCIGSRLNSNYYYNSDFVIGKTYFLRVANATTINSFNFKLCIVALLSPANDSCANARELTPANSCNFVTGTFSGALLENNTSTCAPNASQDVWYKFTATSETMAVAVERASFNWTMYFAFELLDGSCSGAQRQCINTAQNSNSFLATNLVLGNTYYIRVINAAELNSFDFRICLTGPPPVTCTPSVAIAASTTSICQGGSVVFTATPTNGGASPSYQWKVNGSNVGTNSPTFATSTLANGSIVTVVMTSNATCASPTTATSNAITVNVTAAVVPNFTQVAPICVGGTFALPTISTNGISGTWSPATANNTTTTNYTFTPNAGQCATTTMMTVVVHSVNTATTTQGNTVTASAANATYQWINCSNNQPIVGATNAAYTALESGSYAVIVTQNGCSKRSECVTITTLGVDAFVQNGWKIYPNPATHQLHIELVETTDIAIIDLTGKIIRQETLKAGDNNLNVSELPSGMYFVKSASGAHAKFVKQ